MQKECYFLHGFRSMGFLYQAERYLLPGFIILDGFLLFNIQRLWRFGSQHTLLHNQVIETNSMSQARRVQQQQQTNTGSVRS